MKNFVIGGALLLVYLMGAGAGYARYNSIHPQEDCAKYEYPGTATYQEFMLIREAQEKCEIARTNRALDITITAGFWFIYVPMSISIEHFGETS